MGRLLRTMLLFGLGCLLAAAALACALWLAAVSASAARAHSWYPYDCCSERDCWPMGGDTDAIEPEPRLVPGGWLTHDGVFVAQRETRPSRDGRFHICRQAGLPGGALIRPAEKPVCLFVPQPGS